jgi:sulfite reductase beta subunit-like hemoprotein
VQVIATWRFPHQPHFREHRATAAVRAAGDAGDDISMACVSFPTCPLAMAEAERFLPSFIDKVEGVMSTFGQPVTRVTICSSLTPCLLITPSTLSINDGRKPGRYNLHIGGNRSGTRIPRMYRENITESEILDSGHQDVTPRNRGLDRAPGE